MDVQYDIEHIKSLLNSEKWMWAKTMPGIPHEYIVRGKTKMSEDDFLMIVHAQRDLGKVEIWGNYSFPYLYVDGYKYWTMGDTFENTIILNRQKVFSEFNDIEATEYDVIPFGVVSNLGFHIRELIEGRFIYEVACGAGGSVEPLFMKPEKYIGIDPCSNAIDEFKKRYPNFADRLYVSSFEESVNYWSKGDALILATFGAASYLMEPYLKILEGTGKDYILMFYKEGYCPEEYKDTHYFKYTLDDIHSILPSCEVLPFGDYYLVSNMGLHKHELSRLIEWELSHFDDLFTPNDFYPKVPYNTLFVCQMESIMKDGDNEIERIKQFVDLSKVDIDYEDVARRYNEAAKKCCEYKDNLKSFRKESFSAMEKSAYKRVAYFKCYD